MMLGRRGYEVVLAEAGDELGGRVAREARLPGLAAWIRVVDYRRGQLARLAERRGRRSAARSTAEEVASYGFDHVAVATGAAVARRRRRPLAHAAARARRRRAGADARRPDARAPGPTASGS